MRMGEAARLTGTWILGLVVLAVGGGALLYGTWLMIAGLFEEPAPAQKPLHVIIGLDLSQGNPLILNDVFSTKAGARVARTLEDLPMRSKVTLRSFGSYSSGANPLTFDRVISQRHPPAQVQRVVRSLIGGVPELVARGRLRVQQQSNIVPFLENMSQIADCSAADTYVILVTDGLEDSEIARLGGDNDTLPPPSRAYFQDCKLLEMLGLGQGLPDHNETRRLRDIWSQWAKDAGFESFRGLNDW